jgi:hypothetical protein
MTERRLVEYIRRNIQQHSIAKISAMEVFNLLEPNLKASSEFTEAVVAFANNHDWNVYTIGEVPFGELVFYPTEALHHRH